MCHIYVGKTFILDIYEYTFLNYILLSLQMPELTVTSEIYEEYDYKTKITPSTEGSKSV